MSFIKKNIRYFILMFYIFTNGLIISESALEGGSSGARSSIVSLILSIFVNKTVPGPEPEYVTLESLLLYNHEQNEIVADSAYYVPLGVTRRVSPTFLPSNTTDKSLIWSSSNEDIVAVYPGGYLEARSIGQNVKITATPSKASLAVSFYVNVHEKLAPPIFETSLSKNSIEKGDTSRLEVNLSTQAKREYDSSKLIFYSEDNSVATINEYGVIVGVDVGTTTVGIEGSNNTYEISVIERTTPLIKATQINLDIPTDGYVYDKTPLNYTFDVENVSDNSVTWVSSNEAIGTIIQEDDKYYVYGSKVDGDVTLTAYLNADFNVFASHTIRMNNVLPSSMSIANHEPNLTIGSTLTIAPTLTHNLVGKNDVPVTNQTMLYTSSDPSIAKVSAGNLVGYVVGLKEGTVTITVKSEADPSVSATTTVNIVKKAFINNDNYDDFQTFVRKAIGHFLLFFVDGIFGFWAFYLFLKQNRVKKTLLFSSITGIFFAAISETIQLLIPGRSGQFSDVLIDSSGYLFATFLMLLVFHLYQKYKIKKE